MIPYSFNIKTSNHGKALKGRQLLFELIYFAVLGTECKVLHWAIPSSVSLEYKIVSHYVAPPVSASARCWGSSPRPCPCPASLLTVLSLFSRALNTQGQLSNTRLLVSADIFWFGGEGREQPWVCSSLHRGYFTSWVFSPIHTAPRVCVWCEEERITTTHKWTAENNFMELSMLFLPLCGSQGSNSDCQVSTEMALTYCTILLVTFKHTEIPNTLDLKSNALWHIIIKTLNMHKRENIKSCKGKDQITHKSRPIWKTVDF